MLLSLAQACAPGKNISLDLETLNSSESKKQISGIKDDLYFNKNFIF